MRPIDADALIEFCAERWIPLNVDAVNMQPTIQPEKAQLSKEGTTKDAISRQAAIDALDTAIEHYDGIAEECRKKADIERNDYMDMRDDAYEARQIAQWLNELKYLREKIEQLTIQPEPHEGHWIEGKIYRDIIECNCSECGQLMTTAATVRMNYCPNCGARMVKGEQNG